MTPYRTEAFDPERRLQEVMKAWAPAHARDLVEKGWRLHDGPGLVWIRDDDPSLCLPDEKARTIYYKRKDLSSALRSAGDYRDWHLCDRLEAQLAEVPTYKKAAKDLDADEVIT